MEHAKSFKEFIPSIEEAKLYMREWRNGNGDDRQHYLRLNTLFSANPANRQAQCAELNAAYKCLRPVSIADAVNHLDTIPDLVQRLEVGDPALVDEVAHINDRYQYVFAAMFCHHSNPNAYYGYSRPIRLCLQQLNDLDSFYDGTINLNATNNYSMYTGIMRSMEEFYHIECLSKLEIDIMLRNAVNLPI